MARPKRKVANAKVAYSNFNKGRDRLLCNGNNTSHVDSNIMKQMQHVKKGRNDHTQIQNKDTSLITGCNNSKTLLALKMMSTKAIDQMKLF